MVKYCDLSCEHSRFPDVLSDGSMSCRTFVGLYCEILKEIVPKNAPCRAETLLKTERGQTGTAESTD